MNMDSYKKKHEEDSLNDEVLKYGLVYYHTLDHQYASHGSHGSHAESSDTSSLDEREAAAMDAGSIISPYAAGELAHWKKESIRLQQLVHTQLDIIQLQNEVIVKTEKERRLLKREYEQLKADLHLADIDALSDAPTTVTQAHTMEHIENPVVQNVSRPLAPPVNAPLVNRSLLRPTHYKSILNPMKQMENKSQVRQPSQREAPKITSLTKGYTYPTMLPNKSHGPNNGDEDIVRSDPVPVRMETKTEPKTSNLRDTGLPATKSRSQSYEDSTDDYTAVRTKLTIKTKTENALPSSNISSKNVPLQSMPYTGSLSDRLRLIDKPASEALGQTVEAGTKESTKSPIPKLMRQKKSGIESTTATSDTNNA